MRSSRILASMILATLLLAGPARASVAGDVRGGYYADVGNGFVGGGLLAPVAPHWAFNPNLEWVLVDGYDYMTGNADFHYDLPTAGNTAVWLGGGLALVVTDQNHPWGDRRDSDLGMNLIGGLGARHGSVRPFFQMKGLISDHSEGSLAVGIRF